MADGLGEAAGGAASGAKAGAALGSFIPGVGTAIGGAVGGIAGGIAGLFGGRKKARLTREAEAEYLKYLKDVGVPDPNMFVAQYGFINPDDVETFQPLLESAIQQQETGLKDIQLDPQLRQAKMQALQRLQQTGEEGMTLEERAATGQIARQAGAQQAAAQQQVLAQQARRGTLGSGSALQAQLAASEVGTDQAARAGEALAVERNRRALQAVLEAGGMAGNIEQADYAKQAEAARAQDIINQFNVGQQSGVQQRNVGGQNVAGMTALQRKQQLQDTEQATKNLQAEQLVKGKLAAYEADQAKRQAIAQQQYNAKMAQAGKAGQTASAAGGLLSNIASAAGTGYDIYKANQKPKVPQFTADEVDTDNDLTKGLAKGGSGFGNIS